MYLKRMRKIQTSLQAKSATAQYNSVIKRLHASSRRIRQVRALTAHKVKHLLAVVLFEWMSATSNMSRKRRDLKKLIDRLTINSVKTALSGWSTILQEAKSYKFHQSALEKRYVAHKAKLSIFALVQNLKISRRFRRKIAAFNHRWDMTRLKNACENWSQWHQKKMAVKVLARLEVFLSL